MKALRWNLEENSSLLCITGLHSLLPDTTLRTVHTVPKYWSFNHLT